MPKIGYYQNNEKTEHNQGIFALMYFQLIRRLENRGS